MDLTPEHDGLIRRNTFVRRGGDEAELRRARRQGKLIRVTRGVYRTVDPDSADGSAGDSRDCQEKGGSDRGLTRRA